MMARANRATGGGGGLGAGPRETSSKVSSKLNPLGFGGYHLGMLDGNLTVVLQTACYLRYAQT
jgi:hypothetical protein